MSTVLSYTVHVCLTASARMCICKWSTSLNPHLISLNDYKKANNDLHEKCLSKAYTCTFACTCTLYIIVCFLKYKLRVCIQISLSVSMIVNGGRRLRCMMLIFTSHITSVKCDVKVRELGVSVRY